MAGLEDLQKMAQEGKVSEQLLEDKEFISEMKKIIKEENNLEISDDQAKKIIENFEQSLKDPKLTNESLGNVSGGGAGRAAVKTVTTIFGAAAGMGIGGITGSAVHVMMNGKDFKDIVPSKQEMKELAGYSSMRRDTLDRGIRMSVGAGGYGVVGGVLGNRLGDYICKKFGIQ